MNYRATGSGEGIEQLRRGTVDFAASDYALSSEELKSAQLIQFPTAISAVVLVANIPGIKAGDIKLSANLVAQIFSGKISQWNDARLVQLNPTLNLPNKSIAVIARKDSSGTSYNFSDYLSKASPEWRQSYGRSQQIAWPDKFLLVSGSNDAARLLKRTDYSLSYIDYSHAYQLKLDTLQLQNKDGRYLQANTETITMAAANSNWPINGNDGSLILQAGANSWPITCASYVVIRQVAQQSPKTNATMNFFTWVLMSGDKYTLSADFVRLPDRLQARAFKEMTTVVNSQGQVIPWDFRARAEEKAGQYQVIH